MASEDYYQILGISREASPEDIKKAYRKLALQYHPDKTKGDKTAEAKFKKINEAYQILSDPAKKTQYDQFGASSGGDYSRWSNADFSGFSQGFDFGDIFETFFDASGRRGGGRRNPENLRRGNDIEANLQISFTEAVFGATKPMGINRQQICEVCKGSGSLDGKTVKCDVCRGSGEVKKAQRTILGTFTQVMVCAECKGLGEKPAKPCRSCHGEGRKTKSDTINITIPAGVDSGQTIKLTGLGEAGWRGGKSGDLYINIHVLPSKDFMRQGADISRIEIISYSVAVLGGEIAVKGLENNLLLKIPAGTKSGEVFRLKGKGIKKLDYDGTGDLLIKVEIAVPNKLTLKQRRLLEELGEELK